MKQTVEEAAREAADNYIYSSDLKGPKGSYCLGFKAGAEWQAKQDPWNDINKEDQNAAGM